MSLVSVQFIEKWSVSCIGYIIPFFNDRVFTKLDVRPHWRISQAESFATKEIICQDCNFLSIRHSDCLGYPNYSIADHQRLRTPETTAWCWTSYLRYVLILPTDFAHGSFSGPTDLTHGFFLRTHGFYPRILPTDSFENPRILPTDSTHGFFSGPTDFTHGFFFRTHGFYPRILPTDFFENPRILPTDFTHGFYPRKSPTEPTTPTGLSKLLLFPINERLEENSSLRKDSLLGIV